MHHQVKKIALYALDQAIDDITGKSCNERLVGTALHIVSA